MCMSILTLDAPPNRDRRLPTDTRPHAVIIGSGFGGLAAAIRLGARGYRTTILERSGRPRRTRLRLPPGRLHLRRRADHRDRAVPARRTLGAVRPQPCRTTSPSSRWTRSTASASTTAPCSTTAATPARMRAEVARLSPADVPGYERFMAASEAIFRVGFERLGAVPFTHWTSMAKRAARPGRPRQLAQRPRPGRQSTSAATSCAPCSASTPSWSAVTRSMRHLGLCADRVPGAAVGRSLRHGRHRGRIVQGMARLIRGQGGTIRCNADGRGRSPSPTPPGHRRPTRHRRAHCGRHRRVQRRLRLDLQVTCSPPSTAAAGPTSASSVPSSSMGLFVWYFGTDRRYDDVAHHTHSARSALPRPAARHLQASTIWPMISASTSTARPPPTPRSLRPGCDAFYVLSPVPHLASGTDWAAEGERLPPRHRRRRSRPRSSPASRAHVVTSRTMTPQDFQDRLRSPIRGAAFGMEPVLTQSAWFRPHNVSEEVDEPVSPWAPAPTPAPACPACSARPRSWTRWCPMPSDAEYQPPTCVACRDALRGGSRTFFAAARVLPRAGRPPRHGALRVLPRGRRRIDRREADDAIDCGGGSLEPPCTARLDADLRRPARKPRPADRALAAVVARFAPAPPACWTPCSTASPGTPPAAATRRWPSWRSMPPASPVRLVR